MNSKILILEPSKTTQSFLNDKLNNTKYTATFETDGLKMLNLMYTTKPAAVLINAKSVNPRTSELVRLIKSVEALKNIPLAIYATSDFTFENAYMTNTGADIFIHLETDSLIERLDDLMLLAKNNQLSGGPIFCDIMKSGIAERIFSYIKDIGDLGTLAQNFLNLLTEFCEIPAASLYLSEEDGAEIFYITASSFTETEVNDFIKVCTSEFEMVVPDTNILQVTPQCLKTQYPIDKYHTASIPLSAFQTIKLISQDGGNIGTVNVVREGAFTTHQLDLLQFCTMLFNSLVENAITLKKKIKFEKNIRRAFSRFVPEQIIDELVDGAASSDKVSVGEKRDVAILFSDIRSFTSISELNKPETIVAFLNRYFTTMCTIIKKHGGTIDKFIGDAIMALFGAPVSYEDNARRALAAAYEMREALPSVPLEDLVLPPGMTFNIGIGIHYGDVIVGSIGSSDKTDYSVIGDNVNLASRMEGLTKTYGSMILVTDAVKKDIYKTTGGTDGFEFRYLDDVKVKGKEKAVPIYAIDRNREEFSEAYRDFYTKGFELYKEGNWTLAREYFEKAVSEINDDKAANLMLERCIEFEKNPPENWDGAITFHTK
ncbi:Adenylate cyclase, class 3 [Treponema bryantii]|uniref:Adenylate cyclase, class 3 n=1 Tax=Treponema bryantii TaxID=163 RepID=A0A1I3IZX3_9SPIR|nr:adenylate/guanylate cyclase domain-containing protein [Treponema bryantii]SFI53415.1 Adenylate cyclase, class 3 [Treponema bryantii]